MLKVKYSIGRKVLVALITLFAATIGYVSPVRFGALSASSDIPFSLDKLISNNDLNETLGKYHPESNKAPTGNYVLREPLRVTLSLNPTVTPTVLLGIFSRAGDAQRRQLLRDTYALWKMPQTNIRIIFVLGSTTNRTILEENDKHGDIVILKCPENMNEGKTWHYFSAVVDAYSGRDTHPKYVMKADQDSWIHLPNLLQWIETMPDEGAYFGRECYGFMAGMAYGVSYNIAQSLHDDKPQIIDGNEDELFNKWLTDKRGKHRVNSGTKFIDRGFKHKIDADTRFIDHPYLNGKYWSAPMLNTTIVIHKAKAEKIWRNTTQHYFG